MKRADAMIVLCFFVGTANAGITKNPQESDSQFASRYAPNDASAVVHVASAKVWGFEKPVIAAFYQHSVTNEVLGIVFVPVTSEEYRKFEIDSYGQKKLAEAGQVDTTAEIRTVFFANKDKVSDKKLFVIVSWHKKGSSYDTGMLYSTYIYEKPQLNSEKSRLAYIEKLSKELSGGIGSPSKYRTASEVRADLELRILMNCKEDCTHSITRQPNKDRSLMIMLVSECPDSEQRNIQVLYQASQSAKNRVILQLKRELSESNPNFVGFVGAGFVDLEKDGIYEMEITNTCGAGPNCARDIYKLATDRKAMFHYFDGGGADLSIKDGFLFEAGRASCCSWEYRYYPAKAKHYPITYNDVIYMVSHDLETDEQKEKCVYHVRIKGKWKVLKHPPKVIQMCEP